MYMAPEVFAGKGFDPILADIYSMAVILYVSDLVLIGEGCCAHPLPVCADHADRRSAVRDARSQ